MNNLGAVTELLYAARTIATAPGDPAGTWLICGGLIGTPDVYTGKQLLVVNGAGKGDLVDVAVFNPATGRLGVSPALKVQSSRGDTVAILTQSSMTQLTHPDIFPGTTKALWKSGFATSGLAGADLITIGTPGQWFKLSEIYMGLYAFTPAATITVRAYETIMGVERMVMDEDYVVGVDPDIIFIFYFWEIWIYGALRIEVYSNAGADDNLTAPWEYRAKI